MFRLVLVSCLVVASAYANPRALPRVSMANFHGRIIGGNDADPGEYPSQLSLQLRGSHNCGASVISENWALTAAHCIDGSNPSSLTLVAGTNTWQSGGTTHNVLNMAMHAEYNPSDSWINDIAVIEVTPPFTMSSLVAPITLPVQDQPVAEGSPATVIGWGRISQGGPISPTLKEVEIEIRNQDMCRTVYEGIGNTVHDTHICADVPEGNLGSCNGDSGGPLFVDGVVVGLVSWALGCATPGYPTVYTRVPSYRDWITQQTGVLI